MQVSEQPPGSYSWLRRVLPVDLPVDRCKRHAVCCSALESTKERPSRSKKKIALDRNFRMCTVQQSQLCHRCALSLANRAFVAELLGEQNASQTTLVDVDVGTPSEEKLEFHTTSVQAPSGARFPITCSLYGKGRRQLHCKVTSFLPI